MFIKESDLKKAKKGTTVEDILSYIADSNEQFATGIETAIVALSTQVSSAIASLDKDVPDASEKLIEVALQLQAIAKGAADYREAKSKEYKELTSSVGKISDAITSFSKANSIDSKLDGIEKQITERNNSNWEFDIIRDAQNRIQKITTKKRHTK